MQYPPQFNARFIRDKLCQHIGFRQGKIKGSRNILDTHLGRHGAIGDDLSDLISTVFFYYIINYFLPSFIIEVSINIGHRLTVGIKEPFEEQVIFNRIDIGDTNAIGYHTSSSRSPAGPDKHIELTTGTDKITYN